MKKEFKISIRNLVELIMRKGSIDNRYVSPIKAQEGVKGHQKIQNSYGEEYTKEVMLRHTFDFEDIYITIEGRADGIIKEEDKIVIDEIKTTTTELLMIDENYNPLHFAQAKCYGFIYAFDNQLDNIDIQLTYYNLDTLNSRIIRKNFSFEELNSFITNLVLEYKKICSFQNSWINCRNESIKRISFPYEKYRKGQREFAIRVYKAIENSKNCFAEAPTGTGKTISTIFPAIKAMGEGLTSRIFYLTAKTTTREAAENSIKIIRRKDTKLKTVTLTAKEKICKMSDVNCNPEYCPYAKGYYDRINSAIIKILESYENFSRKNIEEISEKYVLCPFELSLELSLFSDIVICDYNYLFDPKVYLKRFFDVKASDYTFLIDEAHNLIDRVREMYTSEIDEEKFLIIKKDFSKKSRKIKTAINEIILFFQEKSIEEKQVYNEFPEELGGILSNFLRAVEEYLAFSNEDNNELLDMYFEINRFLNIKEYFNENFVVIYYYSKKGSKIKIFCANPSNVICKKIKIAKSTTFFSATLIPMDYFMEMYGYTKEDYIVNLPTPFNINNRLVMIADNISTTYFNREKTSIKIVNYINKLIQGKKGNYMVFFSSYEYMNMIIEKIDKTEFKGDLIIQKNNMNDEEKDNFLLEFKKSSQEVNVGFCVLGSHFSEGIDLTYDKLIGVIIVGVGMPKICLERNIIKEKSNNLNLGFDYAYVYPGIIKVLQGAGRCIRTEKDRGVILFIDERYSKNKYKKLLKEYSNRILVRDENEIYNRCKEFWDKN
ncbi:MAG: ATP-dependent DNA helicase [Clostridiales bacterium]|nr:ATP-dependent DNA helicase [Clostridiales bacterium]